MLDLPDLTSDRVPNALPGATGWLADAATPPPPGRGECDGGGPGRGPVVAPAAGFCRARLPLVSVGYMDPGNWATDLAGGSKLRLHAALGDPAVET